MAEEITVYDKLSDTTFKYNGLDEMCDGLREMFREEVYPVIDKLAEAMIRGEYTGEYEAYLCIRIN